MEEGSFAKTRLRNILVTGDGISRLGSSRVRIDRDKFDGRQPLRLAHLLDPGQERIHCHVDPSILSS